MKKFLSLIYFAFSFIISKAQLHGCPDPAANNYDSLVTINDGSCTYNNATLNPKLKYNLNTVLNESSGLIWWKKLFWTHDDSGGQPEIYAMNASTNAIQRTVVLKNATNVDWEDVAQDNSFIYIGDFGNNANGNRTDLKIYKISKASVSVSDSVQAGVISFSYSDQTDFSAKGNNNTNYDCEALIAYGDSLYLFSKDWIDLKTRLYSLPKKPGTFKATKLAELDVQGLITGADVLPTQRVIVLSGYNSFLSPFIYLLYDFSANKFFAANKRKVLLNESFTQTEGISAKTSTQFFTTNERVSKLGITTPAKLEQYGVSALLNPYYSRSTFQPTSATLNNSKKSIHENKWAILTARSNTLHVHLLTGLNYAALNVYDAKGILVIKKDIAGSFTSVNISSLANSVYIAKLSSGDKQISLEFIKE
jgi:hypothetical protein